MGNVCRNKQKETKPKLNKTFPTNYPATVTEELPAKQSPTKSINDLYVK